MVTHGSLAARKNNMNYIPYQKIIRFVVAGGVVATFNVILLRFFVGVLHLHYLFASSFSFVFALILNFILQRYWVFKGIQKGKTIKQFLLFSALVVLNFFLNLLSMFLLVERVGIQYLLAQIFTIIILAVLNFFVYQRFIFSNN